ncbi:MAG TPA: pyridoxal phosphate-dependent aminotransferase [Thermoanaerobaculia bacterium]|jgi:N-succinyldiaminopimelate aminotransferase|nr:pyridoxal phosphate-dependent aminotransferase [Thermoanaerobaculia bacterium]
MPRHPHFSPSVDDISGAVYSALAHRLASFPGEVYPLHVGDTWMEPPEGCRMEDLTVAQYPGMHRYAPPQGMPALIDALVEQTRARSGAATERENILITTGATGGLGAVAGAILTPGDEVLLLAPHWPLITGIVRSFHGVPVDVPFFGAADSPETAVDAVRAKLTPRTAALYLNTPSNPAGQVIPRSWIEALVAFAERENLWILSDEVYEDYVYNGEHTYTRPLAPERTFASHSFSKAFGMAGNRCGHIVGPTAAMPELRKISLHSFYSTPTASQLAALRVLNGPGAPWIVKAREQYRRSGEQAAARLGIAPPQGSTFLFLDVADKSADKLDERGLGGFLEDCVDRGLFVAPGPSFGPYPTHIRLCFTAAPPDIVTRGVEVLASVLGL